jgi:hypothetical protein
MAELNGADPGDALRPFDSSDAGVLLYDRVGPNSAEMDRTIPFPGERLLPFVVGLEIVA